MLVFDMSMVKIGIVWLCFKFVCKCFFREDGRLVDEGYVVKFWSFFLMYFMLMYCGGISVY